MVKTIILNITFTSLAFISVRSKWFGTYLGFYMGAIHDFYIKKISSDYCDILMLGLNNKSGFLSVLPLCEDH